MFLKKPYLTVIVDDDEDICISIQTILENKYKNDLKIVTFLDANAAYEFIDQNDVLLVISDLKMPDLHGETFLKKCKDLEKGIYTITMTGYANLTTTITRFRDGDVGILVKPFELDELKELVNLVILSLEKWTVKIQQMVRP